MSAAYYPIIMEVDEGCPTQLEGHPSLEKAYLGREHDLAYSNVWPMFDSLRSDPRFKDLMRRIGLSTSLDRSFPKIGLSPYKPERRIPASSGCSRIFPER
jgi:hypothetical protein